MNQLVDLTFMLSIMSENNVNVFQTWQCYPSVYEILFICSCLKRCWTMCPLAIESNILKEPIKPPSIVRTVVSTITGDSQYVGLF